jgi:hypothetical protein
MRSWHSTAFSSDRRARKRPTFCFFRSARTGAPAATTPFCVCGSSHTLGQRPSTQTALLKPDLLIARGHGDAEEMATPVPSARRHL